MKLFRFIIIFLLISCVKNNNPVYMDYQATTPLDKEVLKEMNEVSKNNYGNAGSMHAFGFKAKSIVENARNKIANVINAKPNEIIFTSGATESNNLAIKGIVESYAKSTGKNHIITVITEHECVKKTCAYIEEKFNIDVTYLYPNTDGLIDLSDLEKKITKRTLLISVMGVNNEIGVIQDLNAIGKIAKKHNVYFHTDCAQAFGKIPLNVENMNIDLMSISGHKIYGPKGIGALYVKNGINLSPIIHGGGQENNLRSGTLPVQLIAGFGKAAEIANIKMEKDYQRISKLSEKLKKGILAIEGSNLNGHNEKRYKGCMNFSFTGVNGIDIVADLKDKIALSIGSACGSSHSAIDSYVIKSLKLPQNITNSAVRFGIGRFTTDKEIDYVIKEVTNTVNKLRNTKINFYNK